MSNSSNLVLLVLGILACTVPVQGYGIGLSGESLSFPNAAPDTVISRTFTISTDHPDDVEIALRLEGDPLLQAWTTFPQQLTVSRSQPARFTLTLHVPENAAQTSRSGQFIITADAKTGEPGSIGILPGINQQMQVTIGEPSRYSCQVQSFHIEESGENIRVRIMIQNKDDVSQSPTLLIKDRGGKTWKRQLSAVLPRRSSSQEYHWNLGWPAGYHIITISIPDCGFEEERAFSYRTHRVLNTEGQLALINITKRAVKDEQNLLQATFVNELNQPVIAQLIGTAYPEGAGEPLPFQSEELEVQTGASHTFQTYLAFPEEGRYQIEAKVVFDSWESVEKGTSVNVVSADGNPLNRKGLGTIRWFLLFLIVIIISFLIYRILRLKTQTQAD